MKKLVNFGLLRKKLQVWMLTHQSTMHILCMLMHLSSSQVTSLRGKFQPHKHSPNQTYSAGQTYIGLCPKFQFLLFFLTQDKVLSSSKLGSKTDLK